MVDREFASVTETPGLHITQDAADMMITRYTMARDLSEGKDVLEVACAAGIGLGLMAVRAKSVIGADFDPTLVEAAKRHYGDRLRVDEADAQNLPYDDASLDVVLLMEAIYFIPDARKFAAEAFRVLRPGGQVLVVTANREWTNFHANHKASRYYSATELKQLLEAAGFKDVRLQKGFPEAKRGLKGKIMSFAKKVVVKLNLIPNTMKGKELMKKLAYGKLVELPREIDVSFARVHPLEAAEPGSPILQHRVVYALATKPL